MSATCYKPTGVSKYGDDVYADFCHRLRFHIGDCKTATIRTYIRSYYDINRQTWPDMTRRRALYSAIRCWWMCRKA